MIPLGGVRLNLVFIVIIFSPVVKSTKNVAGEAGWKGTLLWTSGAED
jgi:hypothetical protein